jgi:beta-lactamase regulating signal transducer with metallopeptidase domain
VAIAFEVLLGAVSGLSGIADVILDVSIKGAAVLLVAYGLTLALRNGSAAFRHLVWSMAVVGVLVLPAIRAITPEWRVPGTALLVPAAPDPEHGALSAGSGSQAAETELVGTSLTPQAESPRPRERGGVAVAESQAYEVAGPPPSAERVVETSVTPVPAGARVDESLGWRSWVLLIWLVGALGVAGWIAAGLLRAHWLARNATTIAVGSLTDLVDNLSEELDLRRPVTLLQSRRSVMPMTWGLRPKLLIPHEATEWTDERLKAVLLHELAHVKRLDYQTQLLARLATVLYWFNPLVWMAARKMRVERELACDDRVLNTGSRPSDYASHLLDIARSLKTGTLMSVSGIAMARRSHLSERLLAVLDATRRRAAVTRTVAVAAWGGAACVVFPVAGAVPGGGDAAPTDSSHMLTSVAAPEATVAEGESVAFAAVPTHASGSLFVPGQGCDWYAREGGSSTSMRVNDDDVEIRIRREDCRLDVEISGEVEFNDAETDVIRLTRGGRFEVEEREGRARRRVEMQVRSDGSLERRWFVDGDEQPYGDEARDWLADIIPLLFRRAGLQAEQRAERILARSGVDGLLREISLIPSDHTARVYYGVLLTQADLNESQIREIVRQAGSEIDSDYELAQLLIEVAESHPVDEAVMVAYVEAAGNIDSDYEQRRVLAAILNRGELSLDVYRAVLQLATDIDSDYELAELLIGLLDNKPLDETLTPEFFAAVATLDSDYEHRRVLQNVLQRGAPSQAVLDLALESAQHLESDYELAELLIEVGQLYPTDQTIPDSYLDAAMSLDSDYELHRVLAVRIERGDMQPESLDQVLEAAGTMDSDHELAELLITLTDSYHIDEAIRPAFFRAVGDLDSDYERSRVLKELLQAGDLTEETVAAILGSALEIDSDYERATLLVEVAHGYRISERLRAMYMEAANDISSEYERNRALAALVEGGGQ